MIFVLLKIKCQFDHKVNSFAKVLPAYICEKPIACLWALSCPHNSGVPADQHLATQGGEGGRGTELTQIGILAISRNQGDASQF